MHLHHLRRKQEMSGKCEGCTSSKGGDKKSKRTGQNNKSGDRTAEQNDTVISPVIPGLG